VEQVGVDLDDVGQVLEEQGVAAFAKSFDELIPSSIAQAELRRRQRGYCRTGVGRHAGRVACRTAGRRCAHGPASVSVRHLARRPGKSGAASRPEA
jgi:hypothetical protein